MEKGEEVTENGVSDGGDEAAVVSQSGSDTTQETQHHTPASGDLSLQVYNTSS